MIYIFTAIFLYIMYRFIVGFVLPVSRATRGMRQQFSDIKEKMQAQQQPQSAPHQSEKPKYDIEGEYIPFEDVKS